MLVVRFAQVELNVKKVLCNEAFLVSLLKYRGVCRDLFLHGRCVPCKKSYVRIDSRQIIKLVLK